MYKMRLAGLFFCFMINLGIMAQPNSQAHFIEANRLASDGNFATAFALIQGEAEGDLNCHAIGYYWDWSLQFGEKVNDSTYQFQANKNQVFGATFLYSFTAKMMLQNALKRCPNNGPLNKAMGYQKYQLALKSNNLDKEGDLMNSVVLHMRQAIRGGTNDSITNFYLGLGLEYQSKYGEAIRYYKKTYALNDAILQSLLKVAACYGKLNQWDSCYHYANEVLSFAEIALIKATALRLKAEALAAKKQRKNAKKLFVKALKWFPTDYDNHLAYVEFLYDTKKKKACKEAVKLLQQHIYHRHVYAALAFTFNREEREEIYQNVIDELPKESKELVWLKAHKDIARI